MSGIFLGTYQARVTYFDHAPCTDRALGWMYWMQAAASMGAFLGPILGGLLYDDRRLMCVAAEK